MRKFKFKEEVQSQAHLRQSSVCAHCGVSLVWSHDVAMPVFPIEHQAAGIAEWKQGVDNCVILCFGCNSWVSVDDPHASTSLTEPAEFPFSHGSKNNGAHQEWVIRMMGR